MDQFDHPYQLENPAGSRIQLADENDLWSINENDLLIIDFENDLWSIANLGEVSGERL